MFARKFLKSLVICLALTWAVFGFYPVAPTVDWNLNPEFMPTQMHILFGVQIYAILFFGIFGMMAAIWCVGTYTGYTTGDEEVSEELTLKRMEFAPWAAPFAVFWLAALLFRCFEKILGENPNIWQGALALLTLMALGIVIKGTFEQLLEKKGA